jgi:hypothetical protein
MIGKLGLDEVFELQGSYYLVNEFNVSCYEIGRLRWRHH